MTDMSLTIAPKSDQLNADDMIAGPITVTITNVSANLGNAEQPVSVSFQDDNGKPYRPCKSMRRVMVHCWGRDGNEYTGRSMTLYRDPEVTWGGMKVGGIRISHMSHIDKAQTMALTATQKQRKPYTVQPLKSEPKQPAVDMEAIDAARDAAAGGTDAFRAWFKANPDKRAAANTIMAALKNICADADAAKVVDEGEDPFGLPPVDDATDTPTPDQIAASERAATEFQAERDARDRDAEGQA